MSQFKISKSRLAEIIKEEYSSLTEQQAAQDHSPALKAAITELDTHWDGFTSQVMKTADDQKFTKKDVASAIRLRLEGMEQSAQQPITESDQALNSIRDLIRQEMQSL